MENTKDIYLIMITETRLYNIKQWVKENFDETILFSKPTLIYGRDPTKSVYRIQIELNPPYKVFVWNTNSWNFRGTIEDWD